MKKSVAENLLNTISEKRGEIVELSRECYADTYNGTQGMESGVIIYEDGDVDTFYRSNNSMSTYEYEGRAVSITYDCGCDEMYISNWMDQLTDEQLKEFKVWLISEAEANPYEDEEEQKEALQDIEENLIDYCNWGKLNEWNEDLVHKIEKEYQEMEIEENYVEACNYKLDSLISHLENELSQCWDDEENELSQCWDDEEEE